MDSRSDPRPERQLGHPEWCSQGEDCTPPRRYPNGAIEWDHWARTYVEGGRGGQVSLFRVEHLTADGDHNVLQGVNLDADGTFTEDQVDELVIVLLQAVRAARLGLDGTPGGLQAVMAAAAALEADR